MKRAVVRLSVAATMVAAMGLLAGCGGDGGPDTGASVPLAGTIQVGPFTINGVTLATTVAGDRLQAGDLSARIERGDGTSAEVDVTLSADGTTLTLGEASVTPSDAGDLGAQSPGQADVRVLATVEATAAGRIDGVTLVARDPQDSFDLGSATAHVERADGTSADVPLAINADHTEVTLGGFSVEPSPGTYWYWVLNRLVIDGPVWVIDGATDTRTQIGSLAFSFGVDRQDRTVVPSTVRACIPTLGVASDRRVVCEGLTPDSDYVWVAITDNGGGVTYSKAYMSDDTGQAVVPDTLGQFTADRISGPDSHIEMCFGNTDRRTPPPVYWPPVPDTGGPGGGGTGLNVLAITGPVQVRNGSAGTQTELGRLRLGFEVLTDGTVVAPATFAFQVPTRDLARDRSLRLTGLQAHDFAQTRVVDGSGLTTRSVLVRADANGDLVIPDAWTGKSAAALSGAASSLSLFIGRTDGDGDGKPDWF